MQIVIDIPDNDYDNIMYNHEYRSWDMTVLERIIANGIDLDKHDEELIKETVANVWGTVVPMSVIEDIRTEIEEELITHGQVIEGEYFSEDAGNINFGLNKALNIIDKHIGKEKE